MLVNIGFRLGYGIAALLAPLVSAKVRLAPNLEDHPEARLFVRGFAAHQVGVAALGLGSLYRKELERPAMMAAIATDAMDVLSAVIESRDRGRMDDDLAGGILFSSAGVAVGAAALKKG